MGTGATPVAGDGDGEEDDELASDDMDAMAAPTVRSAMWSHDERGRCTNRVSDCSEGDLPLCRLS